MRKDIKRTVLVIEEFYFCLLHMKILSKILLGRISPYAKRMSM